MIILISVNVKNMKQLLLAGGPRTGGGGSR
jgi:hypothetical protein